MPELLADPTYLSSLQVTGVFRAVPVRVNPRQRTVKNVYKTYLDVVHIQRTDKRRLKVDDSIVGLEEHVITWDLFF